jgi:hypothetical protein
MFGFGHDEKLLYTTNLPRRRRKASPKRQISQKILGLPPLPKIGENRGMATRAMREDRVRGMTPSELRKLEADWGDGWLTSDGIPNINGLLDGVERQPLQGRDNFDRLCGLQTDAEIEAVDAALNLELSRRATTATERQSDAAERANRLSWIAIGISVMALVIAIVAIVIDAVKA